VRKLTEPEAKILHTSLHSILTEHKDDLGVSLKIIKQYYEIIGRLYGLKIDSSVASAKKITSGAGVKDNTDWYRTKGAKLYVGDPPKEYLKRITKWIKVVGLKGQFPDLHEQQVLEISKILMNAGGKTRGLADRKSGKSTVCIADFPALLHEVTHTNPKYKNSILRSEGGAFALQLLSCGGYYTINKIIESGAYNKDESLRIRALTELSVIFGKRLAEYVKELPPNATLPEIMSGVGIKLDKFSSELGFITPINYLHKYHALPREIGKMLCLETGHSSVSNFSEELLRNSPKSKLRLLSKQPKDFDSVVIGTDETKKKYISAYKTLASFFYINLDYPLHKTKKTVIELFKKKEAMTTAQQIEEGVFDIVAQLYESGYRNELVKGFVDGLITKGSEYARLYAEMLPIILEVTANYGPAQEELLRRIFTDKVLMFTLIEQDGIKIIKDVATEHPDLKADVLKDILSIDWDKLSLVQRKISMGLSKDAFRFFKFLPPELRAKTIVLAYVGKSTGELTGNISEILKKISGVDKIDSNLLNNPIEVEKIVEQLRSRIDNSILMIEGKGNRLTLPDTLKREGILGRYEVIKTVQANPMPGQLNEYRRVKEKRELLEAQIEAYKKMCNMIMITETTKKQFGISPGSLYLRGKQVWNYDKIFFESIDHEGYPFLLPTPKNPLFTNNPLDYIIGCKYGKYDLMANFIFNSTELRNDRINRFVYEFRKEPSGLPEIIAVYEVIDIIDDGTRKCIKHIPHKLNLAEENKNILEGSNI